MPTICLDGAQRWRARRRFAPAYCSPSYDSSAMRRSADADTSRWPHFVLIGHAMPRPPSTIRAFAKAPASSMSGAKCLLRSSKLVRSSSCSRASPAKRTRKVRGLTGRTFVTRSISSGIVITGGAHAFTKSNASCHWTIRPHDGEGKCAVHIRVEVSHMRPKSSRRETPACLES